MSWQEYVDDHLLCELPNGGVLTAGAIVGQDGGVWAQNDAFPNIEQSEASPHPLPTSVHAFPHVSTLRTLATPDLPFHRRLSTFRSWSRPPAFCGHSTGCYLSQFTSYRICAACAVGSMSDVDAALHCSGMANGCRAAFAGGARASIVLRCIHVVAVRFNSLLRQGSRLSEASGSEWRSQWTSEREGIGTAGHPNASFDVAVQKANVMRPSGRAFRVPACEPSSVATGLCVSPGRGRLRCCSCPDKQRHIVSRAVKRESPPSSHGNQGGVCGCRAPSDQRHTVTRAVRQETPPSPYGNKRPRFGADRCVRSGVCIAPTGCLRLSCRSAAPRACARATPSCQLSSPTTLGHPSSEIAHHASRDTQYSDSFLP